METVKSKFRAGDVVRHTPSGEEWIVAAVSPDGKHLCPAGWPESIAETGNCELIEAATDQQHHDWLLKVVNGDGGGMRLVWGFGNLLAMQPEKTRVEYELLRHQQAEAWEAEQKAVKAVVEFRDRICTGEFLPKD